MSDLLTPAAAARIIPRPVAPATVWRWCNYGVTAPDGQRVLLQHERIAGRTYIKRADLDAFLARLGQAAAQHFAAKREPRQSKRAEQKAEAARKLDRRMKATA